MNIPISIRSARWRSIGKQTRLTQRCRWREVCTQSTSPNDSAIPCSANQLVPKENKFWSCRYVVAAIGILLERFQWSRVFSSLGDRILRPVYNCLCLMELAIAYLIESLLLLFHSFNHKVLLYSKLQSRMKVKQVRLKQCSSKQQRRLKVIRVENFVWTRTSRYSRINIMRWF